MSKNKLLILAIALVLLFANSGFALTAAGGPVIPPQPRTLNLKVGFSPITIYPPLVIFTATMSWVPPSPGTPHSVEYFLVSPSICAVNPMSTANCYPPLDYMGSALVNHHGQAVYSQQLNPGTYKAIAKITIDGVTTWSNEVAFKVGQ